MKKIYIQIILISFTLIFLGATGFYYWQGMQVIKISNNEAVENKKIITEEVVSESTPLFNEPIIETDKNPKIEAVSDSNVVEEIIEEREEIGEEELLEIDNVGEINTPTFSIDLYTDSSIQKFVGTEVSFSDISYIPENLVSLSGSYIVDAKGNGQMRKEALDKFEKMSQSFYAEFGEKIVVVSTYRSYVYQKGIKDRGCPDNLCAKAGYSEHQSGLGIDLWEASTNSQFLGKPNLKKYYDWLIKNASSYGFHNSYQKGKTVDGYDIEPWHWRYLGEELATYLLENDLTFTEFYNLQLLDEA